MRTIKNLSLALIIILLTASIGFAFWIRDRYVVPILMYHHVGVPTGSKWRLNTVSVKSFDHQMDFLKRNGFHVLSFDDYITGVMKGQAFARNSVVIQFDDGYEDNYTNAFPILKKDDFPAIVFLISDKIDTPGFLTWDQVREMEKSNFMAGAHTRHHVYLPTVDLETARDEIAGSKKAIEDHLGHKIDYFAYPVGGFNEEIKRIVRESGYKAAAATNRGKDRYNQDLYALKRIHMHTSDDGYADLILWFKLSGYYNLFRHFKPVEAYKRTMNA